MTTLMSEVERRQDRRAMSEETLRDFDSRLLKIEGQLRAIRRMGESGRECVDVVTQIASARAALQRLADVIVRDHVNEWVSRASTAGASGERDVETLLKVFQQYYR